MKMKGLTQVEGLYFFLLVEESSKTRFSHVNLKRLQVLHSSSDRAIKKTAQNSVHPNLLAREL